MKLPNKITYYKDFTHPAYDYNFPAILNDANQFTKIGLINIATDKSLEKEIRQTALFMIGCEWSKVSLDLILEIVSENPELTDNLDILLCTFNIDYGIEVATTLFHNHLLNSQQLDKIIKDIKMWIRSCPLPNKTFGNVRYKNS